MTNFAFLKNFSEFSELASYCEDAEVFAVSKPNLSAISARNALEFVIKYVYKAKVGSLPERASLFELIDSYEISNFINDQVIRIRYIISASLGITQRTIIELKRPRRCYALKICTFLWAKY